MTRNSFDWMERIRILELENQRLMSCQEETLADTNRKLTVHLVEIQQLRCDTRRLSIENQELRSLCCNLDDEREHLKEELNEWKYFAFQAAVFIEKEVATQKEKVQILESRQNELLAENRFMQQLVARGSVLETTEKEEDDSDHRSTAPVDRDAGDGSSETEYTPFSLGTFHQDQGTTHEVYGQRLHKPSSLPHSLWPRPGSAVDTQTCLLSCMKSFEYRLRKLEQNPHQSNHMQTSMSAPELEAACMEEQCQMKSASGSLSHLINESGSDQDDIRK